MVYGEEPGHGERRFHALIEHSTDAIVLLERDGMITYTSPSTERITGYTPEELVGTHFNDLIRCEDWEHVAWHDLLDLPGDFVSFEFRMRHKNGSWRRMEGTLTNLLDDLTISALVGSYRDITERKVVEERLEQNEERYRVLVEQASDGIFLTDVQGRFIDVNMAVCALSGYSHDELLTKNIADLTREEDRERLFRGRDVLLTGEILRSQWLMKRKDGSLIRTELTSKLLSNGYLQGIVRDISERKDAERRKEEFLGMVSHELRSPLTAIMGYLEIAQLSLQQLPKNYSSEVDTILKRTEMMLARANQQVSIESRLVEDLLEVSRMEVHRYELSLKACNLVTVVREVATQQQQIAHNRSFELFMPTREQVPVLIDEDRIRQVLINYLTNALRYSPEDSAITVGLTVEDTTARVFVRDQGPGLTQNQQEHIWERFYQVEASMNQGDEGGLGLGLYIAKIIIEQHGGQVGVESEIGRGSTFWFAMPLASEPARA